MNEARVIALSGIYQALELVKKLATESSIDTELFKASISSIFKIDADSPVQIFGDLRDLRSGLEMVIQQLDGEERDLTLTRVVVTILHLERRLSARKDIAKTLRDGILSTKRQVEHWGLLHSSVMARLAALYTETLSTLRPRVMVHGNPLYLTQPARIEQIRTLLLAAVRAAVLWRQSGGRQWHLVFKRREFAMVARGLLARCALDAG